MPKKIDTSILPNLLNIYEHDSSLPACVVNFNFLVINQQDCLRCADLINPRLEIPDTHDMGESGSTAGWTHRSTSSDLEEDGFWTGSAVAVVCECSGIGLDV